MIIASKTMFKISLFGWELVLLRYPKANIKHHPDDQGIHPSGVYIKRVNNFLMACDDKGYYLQPQISLTVNDSVNGPSTVTVEYFFAGIYDRDRPATDEEKEKAFAGITPGLLDKQIVFPDPMPDKQQLF